MPDAKPASIQLVSIATRQIESPGPEPDAHFAPHHIVGTTPTTPDPGSGVRVLVSPCPPLGAPARSATRVTAPDSHVRRTSCARARSAEPHLVA